MLISGIRAVILYIAMVSVMRLMGKSVIGQLEPFEFVLVILIADLISVPMGDISVPIYSGILPLFTIMFVQILFSFFAMKYQRFRAMISGEPSVIINNGRFEEDEIRRNRVSIDDIIEQIRMQGHANLSEIAYAIMEVSGNISVILRNPAPTNKPQKVLPAVLINDGYLIRKKLARLKIKETEIDQALKAENINSYKDCLIMYRETDGTYFIQAVTK